MRRLVGSLANERGTATVELAIVLPVLLSILVGIMYFGRFENYSIDAQHLASEAVRYAAVDFDPSGSQTIQNFVLSQAPPELANGSTDVPTAAKVYIYFPSNSSNTVGNSVRACVTATVHFLPLLGNLTNSTITQTATMRIEQVQTSSVWTPDTPPSQCPTS